MTTNELPHQKLTDTELENRHPVILCIDDDPEISRTIELRLRDYDAVLLSAYHGMQGFWLAMTEQPDLIITDVKMPQGTGDYVVECLKRNSETRHIPVLVLSGSREAGLKQHMLSLGVEDFFAKPCAAEELLVAMRRFVKLAPAEEVLSD